MTVEKYYNSASTHYNIIGAARDGYVKAYLIKLDLDGYKTIFSDKPCQSKRQTVIKYRSSKTKVEYLTAHALQIIDLCTEQELKDKCRTFINKKGEERKENCGECFEWLMAQYFGVSQNEKSNLTYREGGDMVINGIPYQVKYEKSGIAVG